MLAEELTLKNDHEILSQAYLRIQVFMEKLLTRRRRRRRHLILPGGAAAPPDTPFKSACRPPGFTGWFD